MTSTPLAARGTALPPSTLGFPSPPQRWPRVATPFARDVLAGLARPHKAVPSRWLYDERGAALLEQIAQLDEGCPARTEIAILERCAGQIAAAVGPEAALVEFGAGANRTTPILLAALDAPSAFISAEPTGTLTFTLPCRRRVGYLPGSMLSKVEPDAAAELLERVGRLLGDDSMLVVGVESSGQRAGDDRTGLTAALHKNLLVRINRELEGDFDARAFRHEVRFNAEQQRVEMHLVSTTWESFEVLGRRFGFPAGDSIHTQNSYRYSLARFHALARRAGWAPLQFWTDAHARFGVHVLERMRASTSPQS